MEKYIQDAINSLQSIDNFLNSSFWSKYDFWLGFANLLILGVTLVFILKYTRATQEMKEEMVKQRIMTSANNIDLKMTRHYLIDYPGSSTFGELKTPINQNNICSFKFLDLKSCPIGRCSIFYKKLEKDNELFANYFMDDKNERTLFLEALNAQNGLIKAKVITTGGYTFLYTLKAIGNNWRITFQNNHPNLNDEFILIKKEITKYN